MNDKNKLTREKKIDIIDQGEERRIDPLESNIIMDTFVILKKWDKRGING